MITDERIEELLEKRTEFILNESVFADDHPSWAEVAEANAEAESRWDETEDGKELKALFIMKASPDLYAACDMAGYCLDHRNAEIVTDEDRSRTYQAIVNALEKARGD